LDEIFLDPRHEIVTFSEQVSCVYDILKCGIGVDPLECRVVLIGYMIAENSQPLRYFSGDYVRRPALLSEIYRASTALGKWCLLVIVCLGVKWKKRESGPDMAAGSWKPSAQNIFPIVAIFDLLRSLFLDFLFHFRSPV